MNRPTDQGMEPLAETGDALGAAAELRFKFGTRWASVGGASTEIFTLTLGKETIDLLPLKNWSQLDSHKWRARGQLPGTPTGLEVALDHVKLMGETVYTREPDACVKLEKLFAEWVKLENERLELIKKQAQSNMETVSRENSPEPVQALHFEVDTDAKGQVHVRCMQGKATAATIGLTVPGFQSLVSQRLLRKPRAVKTGVLHDWVELDGVLYSFQEGKNDAEKLARALNEHFLPASALGEEESIVVFGDAATSTGLELQFAARVGGVPDHHRRPLDQATLELLQDPERCGLLQPGIVVKLAAPNIIFKRRTPEGGEEYLPAGPDTQLRVRTEDGEESIIELSQPLDYMRLSPIELTAAFNHPSVNRVQKMPSPSRVQGDTNTTKKTPPSSLPSERPPSKPTHKPAHEAGPPAASFLRPNHWLGPLLRQPALDHQWLIWLLYGKMAEHVGNSEKGRLDSSDCWLITMSGANEPTHADFRGFFLIENDRLGFIGNGKTAQFGQEAVLLSTGESVLKAAGVRLLGIGIDASQHFVFLLSDDYLEKFGVPAETLGAALTGLKQQGVSVMSIEEATASETPIEIMWTVPAEQATSGKPQAIETQRDAATLSFPKPPASNRAGFEQAA